MIAFKLYLKVVGLCYMILSPPYAALALEIGFTTSTGSPENAHAVLDATPDLALSSGSNPLARDIVVDAAAIPTKGPKTQPHVALSHEHQAEDSSMMRVVTKYMTPKMMLALILAEVSLTGFCIALVPGCGTFVGTNIRGTLEAYRNARRSGPAAGKVNGGSRASQ